MDIKGWRRFAQAAVANPVAVGAIAPSSRFLARAMVADIDWKAARYVLEFGPGTGVFTAEALRHLPEDGRMIAIELNANLAADLQRRFTDPRLTIINASVTKAPALCQTHGFPHADAILSGLPWAAFSPPLQQACLDAALDLLPPNAHFATFAYLQGLPLPAGRRFADLLQQRFSSVKKSSTIWRNLPPALVYRCLR